MYLLVKAIFVAVEGGPGTVPSWELFKQQLGLPSGVGDPMRTSRHQSKNRYGVGPYKFGINTSWQYCSVLDP
jgi:hypothetical protein